MQKIKHFMHVPTLAGIIMRRIYSRDLTAMSLKLSEEYDVLETHGLFSREVLEDQILAQLGRGD